MQDKNVEGAQWPGPVTLQGSLVRLEPLSHAHYDGLVAAASDGELWNLWYTAIPSPAQMKAEIDRRLELRERGSMLPFAVIETATNEPAGMTTYMNVDAPNRRLEIGSTWYRRRVQRTGLNTECKLLLLTHAFETLDCIAVEFRTSSFNHRSRAAIERLGAKLDGVLRSHAIVTHPAAGPGVLRDTYVYSITAVEWPAVHLHLAEKYARTINDDD